MCRLRFNPATGLVKRGSKEEFSVKERGKVGGGKLSAYTRYSNYKALWSSSHAILSSFSSSMTTLPSPNSSSLTFDNAVIRVIHLPTASKQPLGWPITTATW